MRSRIMWIKSAFPLIFALLTGLFLFRFSLSADRPRAVVSAVYDGDTIKVRFSGGRSEIVRLIGVDAPELGDTREEVLFWAMMSKRFAFTNLYREGVRLEYDWERRDRHGRLLAYVFLREFLFNEIMIRRGFAHAFLKYPFREEYRLRFAAAEQEARNESRGLWRGTPYPLVGPAETKRHIGEIMRVRFVCGRIEGQDKYVFLHASRADFAALVERRDLSRFPQLRGLVGNSVTVLGLVEEYRGHPQVLLFLPLQLQNEDHRARPPALCPDSGRKASNAFP